MTYGIASHDTTEILRAAGLVHAIEKLDEDVVWEVDIVFAGALDESFQVNSADAYDVAAVLFEAIEPDAASKGETLEVSVYCRTNPDDCYPLAEHVYDPSE
jgi:hypothetical protein